ncbi:MAG: leucyl aminopeptidase [Candidatus Helarchaeota archaeon]|nr:leucyl aminopeptidase [Candidatus Helarchaeota archaeon]
MKVRIVKEDIHTIKGESLIIPSFEEKKNRPKFFDIIDKKLDNAINKIIKKNYFKGKLHEIYLLPTYGKIGAENVVLVGLGKKKEFSLQNIFQILGTVGLYIKKIKFRNTILPIYEPFLPYSAKKDLVKIFVQELLYAKYSYNKYKSEKEKDGLEEIILLNDNTREIPALKKEAKLGVTTGESTNFARELSNAPSNEMTPAVLAGEAVKISKKYGIKCTTFGLEQIKKMNMGAFYAVAKGSRNPAKLIVVKYNAGKRNQKPIIIVGKGITFDSGGISIKPGKDMDKMKYDMAGAAAVLGTIRAVAEMNLPVNITGIIPATENLPSGNAYKPGDILKTISGKTIEVINTDAEGRLILADALAYAEKFNPSLIIDLATLTGACVVALGYYASGIIGNKKELIEEITKAGEYSGERVWELPLWKDYFNQIKSDNADMKNTGGSPGGTITAAAFLNNFINEKIPWVHIDIAGTAWIEDSRPYIQKGATGVGVKLLIQFILSRLKK